MHFIAVRERDPDRHHDRISFTSSRLSQRWPHYVAMLLLLAFRRCCSRHGWVCPPVDLKLKPAQHVSVLVHALSTRPCLKHTCTPRCILAANDNMCAPSSSPVPPRRAAAVGRSLRGDASCHALLDGRRVFSHTGFSNVPLFEGTASFMPVIP